MMTQNFDGRGVEHPLVRDYLERLRAESARLPADQAHELYADISEHLRAALGDDSTEADVRERLDRMGSPSLLVSEAGGGIAPEVTQPARAGGLEAAAVTTLIVAELVFFLMPILGAFTWIAGLVTLVVSRYWTASEKLRGFLALGTGYPIVFFVVGWLGLPGISTSGSASCSSSSVTTERGEVFEGGTRCVETGGGVHWSGVVVLVLLAAYLVLQVITARRLLRSRG